MLELVDLYVKYYHENKDKFFCLHSGVAISILSSLYNKFIIDSGIEPFESIRTEKMEEYKMVAQSHSKDGYDEEKIMKSAYALELITSSY